MKDKVNFGGFELVSAENRNNIPQTILHAFVYATQYAVDPFYVGHLLLLVNILVDISLFLVFSLLHLFLLSIIHVFS